MTAEEHLARYEPFNTFSLALLEALFDYDATLTFDGAAPTTLTTPELEVMMPADALIEGDSRYTIYQLRRYGILQWIDGPTVRDNDADRAAHKGVDHYAIDVFRMHEVYHGLPA